MPPNTTHHQRRGEREREREREKRREREREGQHHGFSSGPVACGGPVALCLACTNFSGGGGI